MGLGLGWESEQGCGDAVLFWLSRVSDKTMTGTQAATDD
jgi:hypothetical protein